METQPGAVRGAVFDAHFDDVGTVEDYRRTCRALAGDADGNVIDPLATVAADARLRGCIVWPGARVPPAPCSTTSSSRATRPSQPAHASRTPSPDGRTPVTVASLRPRAAVGLSGLWPSAFGVQRYDVRRSASGVRRQALVRPATMLGAFVAGGVRQVGENGSRADDDRTSGG